MDKEIILDKVGQIVKIKWENIILSLMDNYNNLKLDGQMHWTKMFKKCSKGLGMMLKKKWKPNPLAKIEKWLI